MKTTVHLRGEKKRLKTDAAAKWLESREEELRRRPGVWKKHKRKKPKPPRQYMISCWDCKADGFVVLTPQQQVRTKFRCCKCGSKQVRVRTHRTAERDALRSRTEAIRNEMFPSEKLPWEE